MLFFFIIAQEPAESNQQLVSQVCLDCMCEVASGCNTTIGCTDRLCGPFLITWGYWRDAGKPTLNNEPNNIDGGELSFFLIKKKTAFEYLFEYHNSITL